MREVHLLEQRRADEVGAPRGRDFEVICLALRNRRLVGHEGFLSGAVGDVQDRTPTAKSGARPGHRGCLSKTRLNVV
jgi:hypothetical protein